AEVFFEMLANITQGGIYVDPAQIALELERLFAPSDPQGDKYLQIMTIHKSKGLEFDKVILPNMNSRGANDDKTLLRWMTVPDGLLLAPLSFSDDVGTQDSIYEYLRDIDKKRATYERLRLIYVACTRAKSKLILSANTSFKDDEPKLQYDSMLQDLWPAIENNITYPDTTDAQDDAIDSQPDNRLYRKHNLNISLAEQHKTTSQTTTPISQTSIERYPNASITRRAIGIVTHRWLEYLAGYPAAQSEDFTNYTTVIKQQLQQSGVTETESDVASSEVVEHLQQTLSCDMGQFILGQHTSADSELALERNEDRQVRYYVIDRTFIDADGTRWIVDYKTSYHEGAGRDDFLKEQRKKYNEQLENYASLFAAIESRPIKLMIYFTRYQKYELWDWNPTNNGT
ncbi:MAG: hypothetical protein HKP09_05765, partial [Enterobacterales bacterium]|nr:hypothetical protein [Enterobacterales bacterium]